MADEREKFPLHLQKQEVKLEEALTRLRSAYDIAIKAEEQLKDTLHSAKEMLEQNNY